MANTDEASRLERLAGFAVKIDRAAGRALLFVSRHWLAMVNAIVGLYALLPFVSPLFYHYGMYGAGKALQVIYMPFCHQRPERSYFLFGRQLTYDASSLQLWGGADALSHTFVGNDVLGYKVAFCERDVAIYLTMLIAGLLFAFLRKRLGPISLWTVAAMSIPMAVDGFGQLLGFWTSTWLSRTITGAMFGLGVVLLVYPYAEAGMADAYQQALKLEKAELKR